MCSSSKSSEVESLELLAKGEEPFCLPPLVIVDAKEEILHVSFSPLHLQPPGYNNLTTYSCNFYFVCNRQPQAKLLLEYNKKTIQLVIRNGRQLAYIITVVTGKGLVFLPQQQVTFLPALPASNTSSTVGNTQEAIQGVVFCWRIFVIFSSTSLLLRKALVLPDSTRGAKKQQGQGMTI